MTSPKYPDVRWERYKGDEESIKKYLDENPDKLDPIEGIYSNSSATSQDVLFGITSYTTAVSNDFARVAIIKENKTFGREFIEVIIKAEDVPKYAISADFTRVQNDKVYLSKQFSPDGKSKNYTFSFDPKTGFLEGRNKDQGITSRISYIKLYPVK